MGNCIGKKSRGQNPPHCYSSSANNQLNQTKILPSLSILSSDNNEENIVQYSSEQLLQSNDLVKDSKENIVMGYLFSKEIKSESHDTSPSPSFSSISYNSTSFSSQDQLILPSSSSSSLNIKPSQSLKNPIFLSTKNFFHSNLISHHYKTLSSVIDDILQQEFIRIHRQTKTILIESKQFECIHIHDIKKFNKPSFIFDENQKLVYLTKYADWNEFQSITSHINDSSCDYCSSILSGWKFNKYFHSFLIVNTTYNLMQICFNQIDKKSHLFGYISQIDSNRIQQMIINNSKLNYSYDLDVEYTNIDLVLRVQSWPNEIRLSYEKRQRLWPLNIENLFDKTCFIRYNGNENEVSTNNQCLNCKKSFSSSSNSFWCYTYTAIEAELVLLMSDGQIHFASILWNYFNRKTEGEFSFNIFKHTLFYFFEQYSSDSFEMNDLFNYISLFMDYLFNCLDKKYLPDYFNSNSNLYDEKISINLISFQMNYFDLKHFSNSIVPKSSLYLYHLMYLIQFQSKFFEYFFSSKTNLVQTIFDTHELVIKQLSAGVKTYKRQLDSTIAIQSYRLLTLDCLYQYQEENVQMIVDYLPLLREKEPSLVIHLFWSIFIQYFNSLFDDLFISSKNEQQ